MGLNTHLNPVPDDKATIWLDRDLAEYIIMLTAFDHGRLMQMCPDERIPWLRLRHKLRVMLLELLQELDEVQGAALDEDVKITRYADLGDSIPIANDDIMPG